MKDNIIDFHVRLWNGSVSIHDKENLDYALYAKGQCGERLEGFQCNYHEGTEEYEAQKRICAEIAEKFRELGKLLREDEADKV